ncbi:MAG: 30S ribosomal protein S2 [Candidatus Saccharimonadales bacterium]
MSVEVDIKELLAAGAHFGHKTSRWHPKMAGYIHSKRDGSHIIDLTKTVANFDEALAFLTQTAADSKKILFVGTKRQVQDLVREAAVSVGQPYVTERWLGGMLTNWNTVGTRVKRLKELEAKMESGELAHKYSKLEVQRYQEEIDELNRLYGGIKGLNSRPGAVFIIDVVNDANAVLEARKLNLPIAGITDTNADPTLVTYPIPGNDDALKAIKLYLDYVVKAIQAGQAKTKTTDKDG